MKSFFVYIPYVAIFFLLQFCSSKAHVHKHHIRRAVTHRFHSHLNLLNSRHEDLTSNKTHDTISRGYNGLNKEVGKCEFPSDAGLTPITPHAKNAGWAMSPDEQCLPGSYCPYACPSGKVMAQWNPNAKAYTYPLSMDGGLFCDHDGQVKKPFPDKPYCVSGTGGVGAHNKIGKGVSFCQTVLPGGESMLIPTHVEEKTELAVPGTNYWCKTAAHYYINPPGVGVEEACVWGDESKPVGNWSPYVAGANTDESGQTFVKVGWNPIYTGSALSSKPPNFGVKITCENGNCNGTPCSIDPAVSGVGRVLGTTTATGAGGADFCVVTVPKGSKANIEVFNSGSTPNLSEGSPAKVSPSQPPKSSPSSSSNDGVSKVKPTESINLELPKKPLSSESLPSFNSAESSEPLVTSSLLGKESTSAPPLAIPEPREKVDGQMKTGLNSDPAQVMSQGTVPAVASTSELANPVNELSTDNSQHNISTTYPANTATDHSHSDKSFYKSTLFETGSEFTSMASAGTEHTAAFESHAISGSPQQESSSSKKRVVSHLRSVQICLSMFIFILL